MPQNVHKKQLFRQLVITNLAIPNQPGHNLQSTAYNIEAIELRVSVPKTKLKKKVFKNSLFILQILQDKHPHHNPPSFYLRVIL